MTTTIPFHDALQIYILSSFHLGCQALLEQDMIYTVTLTDAVSGAVRIADSRGVDVAASLLASQFEDADAGAPVDLPSTTPSPDVRPTKETFKSAPVPGKIPNLVLSATH